MAGSARELAQELRRASQAPRRAGLAIHGAQQWRALPPGSHHLVTQLVLDGYPDQALDLSGCTALQELQLRGGPVRLLTLGKAMHTLAIDNCPDLDLAALDLAPCGAVLDSLALSRCRVTSIGSHGGPGTLDLRHCSRLRNLDLSGSTLAALGADPFAGCGQLSHLDASNCTSLADLGPHGFQDCSALRAVNLAGCSALRGLGSGFEGCTRLANVDLSGCAALRWVGAHAFEDCPLVALSLSGCSSIAYLGTRAFAGAALAAIDLTTCTALLGIDTGAFRGCGALVDVAFPPGLVHIGTDAFAGCHGLRSVDLRGRSALRRIRARAFAETAVHTFDFTGCAELRCIDLDAVNEAMDPHLDFAGCVALRHLHCTLGAGKVNLADSTRLVTIGEFAFSHREWHFRNGEGEGDPRFRVDPGALTLPPALPALESIRKRAFRGRGGNHDFSASTHLSSIGAFAFQDCNADCISFAGCTALERVHTGAFHSCSATVIDLSHCAALAGTGRDSFAGCAALHTLRLGGCAALTELSSLSDTALVSLDISECTLFSAFKDNSLACPALETVRLPADAPMASLPASVFGLSHGGTRRGGNLATVTFVHSPGFKRANPKWFEVEVDWGLKRATEAAPGQVRSITRMLAQQASNPAHSETVKLFKAKLVWLEGLVARAEAKGSQAACVPRRFDFDLELFSLCPQLYGRAVTVDGLQEATEDYYAPWGPGGQEARRDFLADFGGGS